MMKKFISSALLIVLLSSLSVFAQEDKQEMSPEQKAWMEYMTPGIEHEQLAIQVGNWTFESKYWMDPGNPEPMVSNGTSTTEAILGGRYFKMTSSGEMMGMPFNGIGITGFDNAEKVYVSIWMDDMGTGMFFTKGTADENGVIELKGSMLDPMMNVEAQIRELMIPVSDDQYKIEMYTDYGSGEFKSMEILFTRAK